VYLYRNNALQKINVKGIPELENIEKPILGFCNKCIYISHNNVSEDGNERSSYIYILDVSGIQIDDTAFEFSNREREFITINLGAVKNHAFTILRDDKKHLEDESYIIICCETVDNQIDFARLLYNHRSKTFEIEQISEIVNRDRIDKDPIVKFRMVYDNSRNKRQFAIALRESGHVDLYWNYYLI
jgi:hypothetical protein